MKEITIKIKGLKCSGCEKSLKEALEKIDGVHSVLPSYLKGEVKLTFDENKVNLDLIEKTIKKNGREVIK